jgi:hypothetical protein
MLQIDREGIFFRQGATISEVALGLEDTGRLGPVTPADVIRAAVHLGVTLKNGRVVNNDSAIVNIYFELAYERGIVERPTE